MGLIPIPIAPGVAVTPAGTKALGPKPNLWLHLGKTPKIPVFNHFHSPTPPAPQRLSAQPSTACAQNKCSDSPRGRKPT